VVSFPILKGFSIPKNTEAYEILKEQVSHKQPPIDPHDDSIDFIWPSVPGVSGGTSIVHPSSPNHYEYLVYDEPEPHRHVARLMQNIRRGSLFSSVLSYPFENFTITLRNTETEKIHPR